jgi:hypothetical protein
MTYPANRNGSGFAWVPDKSNANKTGSAPAYSNPAPNAAQSPVNTGSYHSTTAKPSHS